MKNIKIYFLLFFINGILFPFTGEGQNILRVRDTISVTGSAYLVVKGGMVSASGGGIKNNGTIYMKENTNAGSESWVNNSSLSFLTGTGHVLLNSSDTQSVSGLFPTQFFALTINNSSSAGVNLLVDVIVEDSLSLSDGLVNTSTHFLTVKNPDQFSISGYAAGSSTPSYINGNLRRYINPAVATYGFPVGDSAVYHLAEIVSSGISGVNYLDAKFTMLSNHNDADLSVIESGNEYESVCTDGAWIISPDASPSSANYDVRLYKSSLTCTLQDNEFGILKRPDNSITAADWECGNCGIGTGLSPNGGEGRLAADLYALRMGLSAFSQFGIGKIHPRLVSLPADTSICSGDSLSIDAGIFTNYLWSTGETTSAITVTGTVSGSTFYFIDVINDWGQTSSDTIVVTILPNPELSFSGETDVTCNGFSDGSIEVSVSGGSMPYSYTWSGGETTSAISGLPAGNYTVTVDDLHGCSSNISTTISEPSQLLVSDTTEDASCNGASDGTISISASGGTTPYSFLWTGGGTSYFEDSLSAGDYSVTTTDDNGCAIVENIHIAQPYQLLIADTALVACGCDSADGSAMVTVTGGTGMYSYAWSNNETSIGIDSVTAGNYTLTITDENSCSILGSFEIPGHNTGVPDIVNIVHNSCFGTAVGEADVQMTGGDPPFIFIWSNGQSTSLVSGLSAGDYSVTITDNAGCVAYDSVSITENPDILTEISGSHIACNGGNNGSASILVTGGVAPFQYLWSNPEADTNAQIDNLQAGIYIVTVTDSFLCTATDSVYLQEPSSPITLLLLSDSSICVNSNGLVSASASGGTWPYQFIWNDGDATEDSVVTGLGPGVYTVTVTDFNACIVIDSIAVFEAADMNVLCTVTHVTCYGFDDGTAGLIIDGGTSPFEIQWNNGVTTTGISGLHAGLYSYTVTDFNGCTYDNTIEITQPELLGISASVNGVTCNGYSDGSANISVSGGTSPFVCIWSDSTTTEDLSGMAPATYSVTVTDANGCKADSMLTISEPEALSLEMNTFPSGCYGMDNGSATTLTTGGVAPYLYLWSDGNTSADIAQLSYGEYIITVTDINGCTITDTAFIIQPEQILISDSVFLNNIVVTVSGGTNPFQYLWNGPEGFLSENQNQYDLAPGEYSLLVTDQEGCTSSKTYPIDMLPYLIPNGISPNNDGANDTWNIENIRFYDGVDIEIFNRWGQQVFSFSGTGLEYANTDNQFDGRYKGKELPMGGYLYIVIISGLENAEKGTITLLR